MRRARRVGAAHLDHRRLEWERGDTSAFDEVVVPNRKRDWW
ncbi:hypothetical protein [Rhodococcus sp. NPDC049939]